MIATTKMIGVRVMIEDSEELEFVENNGGYTFNTYGTIMLLPSIKILSEMILRFELKVDTERIFSALK